MDEFLLRAFLAGAGLAVLAGPLGCFVVWRRMAYFGDTMAHAALLGVALGLALDLAPLAGVLIVALGVVAALALFGRGRDLALDTVLGVLSHGALALGLVGIALMATRRVDLLGLLLGDVLAVSWTDVAMVWGGSLTALLALVFLWRGLLASTLDADLARAEGVWVSLYDLLLMALVALTVAMAMKIVGVLLITALLVIPAAAARPWSRSPEGMAVLASLMGLGSVLGGLSLSLTLDAPAGPSMVVSAVLFFFFGMIRRRS